MSKISIITLTPKHSFHIYKVEPEGCIGCTCTPLSKNVNITILFSLCTSDGYHFTIDKQLM